MSDLSRYKRLFCAGVLPALAACGASVPPAAGPPVAPAAAPTAASTSAAPAPPDTSVPAAAPIARRAALRFADKDGDDFPSPLIDVLVSGQPTTMILDTGATHQVIASWIADQIGPTTRNAGDVGIDHAGKTMALAHLDNARIAVSGWGQIDSADAVVVAIPAALKSRGIGGVLSPQGLAAQGRAVVMDFRKGTMTDAAEADAMRALDAESGVAVSGEVKSCGPGNGSLLYVQADIGGTIVDAQLDTGATQTSVRAASAAGTQLGKAAKGKSSALTASGLHTVSSAQGAHVKLGALDIETDVALVPKEARAVCPNDAHVGMDVLRRCVLVVGTGTLAARCAPPVR